MSLDRSLAMWKDPDRARVLLVRPTILGTVRRTISLTHWVGEWSRFPRKTGLVGAGGPDVLDIGRNLSPRVSLP